MNNILKSNVAFVMNTHKDFTKFTVHRMFENMSMYIEYDQLHYDEIIVEADLLDTCGVVYAKLVMLSHKQCDGNNSSYSLDVNKNYLFSSSINFVKPTIFKYRMHKIIKGVNKLRCIHIVFIDVQ